MSSNSAPLLEARAQIKITLTERLTPFSALLVAFVVWLVLFLLTPIAPRWPADWVPIGLFFLSLLTLMLGFAAPHLLGLSFRPFEISKAEFRTIFILCLVIGAIGLSLKLVDLVLFRNVELSLEIGENRRATEASQASLFSSVAALTLPYAFASLVLSATAVRLGYHSRISPVALVIGLVSVLLPVVFGSRSSILFATGQLGVLALLLLPIITKRMMVIGAASLGLVVVVFAALFVLRLQQFGMDYKFVARYSAYTLVTPLSEDYLALIDEADAAIGVVLAAYASILQYALHGMFEFFYLVELKTDHFSWGDYQFFFFSKVWRILTGTSGAVESIQAEYLVNPRAGVFQGLFGPAFIDYGYFLFVFTFALGFVAETVRLRVMAGDFLLLPMHIYLLMTLLLAPMVSGIIMNAGSITLFSYFSLAMMAYVLRSVWRAR